MTTDAQPLSRNEVPCNGCTICCHGEAIVLHPEDGDNPADYIVEIHPIFNIPILAHKPNGDCIYLDDATGCTIHDRAPVVCRKFDCAALVRKIGFTTARKLVKAGTVDPIKLNQGFRMAGMKCRV